MTGFAIRPAVPADAGRLGRVHTAVWREAYADLMPADFLAALDEGRSVARWRDLLAEAADDASRSILVATVDGEVVGFATTGPSRDDPPLPAFELYAIDVLAAHHGGGLAQALLDAALAPAVSLWVVDGNARARSFYWRNGFIPDGLTQTHAGTGTAEVRLVRPARAVRGAVPSGAGQAEAGT